MTGFKLASLWSSKPDQHVKEGSDSIQVEKKKKKSFFGFGKSKKSKNTVEKPSECIVIEKTDVPNNIAFTNNPLKRTPNSPVSAPKSQDSIGTTELSPNKTVQSGTLPNGRLNPLSIFPKKKNISDAFSPSKANSQTAVAKKLTHQSAQSTSFQDFNQEYSSENDAWMARWSLPEPEHKESSSHSDDEEEENDIEFMDGRFCFTQSSGEDSSKNDSSNGSSRVVSLSIRPEELSIPPVVNEATFVSMPPPSHELPPSHGPPSNGLPPSHGLPKLELKPKPSTDVNINESKDSTIEGKEVKKESSSEGVFANGRFCFTEDSTDENSVTDSSNCSSRVVSESFQPEIIKVLSVVPPSQLRDFQSISHEKNTTEETETSVPKSIEESTVDVVSITAEDATQELSKPENTASITVGDATHELSKPENSAELGNNFNCKDSDKGLLGENATDVVEIKAEKVLHTVQFPTSGTIHAVEIVSECSGVKSDTEFIPVRSATISEVSKLEATPLLAHDSYEVLYESSDEISVVVSTNAMEINILSEQVISTAKDICLTDKVENDLHFDCVTEVVSAAKDVCLTDKVEDDLHVDCVTVVENCKKSNHIEVLEATELTAEIIDNAGKNISDEEVKINIPEVVATTKAETEAEITKETSFGRYVNDSTTNEIEKIKEDDAIDNLAHGGAMDRVEKERAKNSIVFSNTNTTMNEIYDSNGFITTNGPNDIEIRRDQTQKQVNTEIVDILSSKGNKKYGNKNMKALALLKNVDTERRSSIENIQTAGVAIDDEIRGKAVDVNKEVLVVIDNTVTESRKMPSIHETHNVRIEKAASREVVTVADIPVSEIKRTNTASKDPVKAEPNICNTEVTASTTAVTVADVADVVGKSSIQMQLPIGDVVDTRLKKDSVEKTKKSIVDTNRKVLAVVKNIEANRSGKVQKHLTVDDIPADGSSKVEQIIAEPTQGGTASNNTDGYSPLTPATIDSKSAQKGLETEAVDINACSANSNVEINGSLSSSKQSYGSSVIPYLALREKPPPVLTRSRTIRVSKDSNESSILSTKSCDANDVHVDIANIYGEPTEEFLSNFMNIAHIGSRASFVERNDSMIAASAESIDEEKSPVLLSLPYLSAKGLMKVDSAEVSQETSNSRSKSISNARPQGKHKSVDSFFGNPFDDIAPLSYTQSEEYAVNEIIDLSCELEISDCTDTASQLQQDAEDHCPYEYKDIMKIDSAESIDFTMNPLRNPSSKSDSSDIDQDHSSAPAAADNGSSKWNWRSVVAGTPSPSLSMMAPSLVKPDGRRKGSRSFSHASASGEDTGLVLKSSTIRASTDPLMLSRPDVQQEETISSPSLATSKAFSKSHRRSGDMIDMDSCLAALLQNPSSITSDCESDGYSVPSIRKVTREIRKCQFQTQSILESNEHIEKNNGRTVPASIHNEYGQQSLQRIRLQAAAVSDYRIKVASNARKNSFDAAPNQSSGKVSIVQPVVESKEESVVPKVVQHSTPQKKVSSNSIMSFLSPGRDHAQRKIAQNNLSGRKLSQSNLSSPAAAKSTAMSEHKTTAHIVGGPKSSSKVPAQESKSNHAIEAVDRALRSASTTAANINRLCNVLQPQPQSQPQSQSQSQLPKDNLLNKSRAVPSNVTVVPQSKPALVEKCTSPSVNNRLDLLMGRGSGSPAKSSLKRVDSILDAELLEKNKVTLSESLVSFDRNVVKEAQRRKLTLAAKLDLQILKEVVESVNRMNFLTAKAKKSLTSMSVEEKKELRTLNQEKARLDRVYEFANSDRSSRKFSSNERILLQPLKQDLERKIKFNRLYRKHKKNEPFSFEEKAEYILLKESLEAEKRFEQLLHKFNSYADEEQRAEKLKKEVTVFERVELIILKLEQDKQQRYEHLLSKEKASLASANHPKLNLAEKSEVIIIKKEIELQYKQHQDKVSLLAHQLRQGYTYSASIDPFTAAISSTRTDEETMANMVNKAFSISMDGYEANNTKCLDVDKVVSPQCVDISVPAVECVKSKISVNLVKPTASVQCKQPSFEIRKESGSADSGKLTTVPTKDNAIKKEVNFIPIKDNAIKKEVNLIEGKNGIKESSQNTSSSKESSQSTSAVTLTKTDSGKHPATSDEISSGRVEKESRRDSTNKLSKIAEEKIRSYFAEKENALAREKQKKLEEFLRRSGSESDNDSSVKSKIEEASKEKLRGVSRDASSVSSSSGDATGVSLNDTYDAYSHFNITQKAELNLLKLEGEKQRRLEEEKQRRLAAFLEIDNETENSSVNSAQSSVGSKSLSSQRNSHHRKSNTISNVITVRSTSSSASSKFDKTSASDNKVKSNVINKAVNHDSQSQKTNQSPPRRRSETPTSSLGLEVLTKVAPKPLRPEMLKKRMSSGSGSVDKIDQEVHNNPPSTIKVESLSRDGDEKPRSISTPTTFQRLLSSSSSVASSSTTNGSKPRRQPAIVQIFEQAKELHRKSEIERIESLKNDPSRRITDPPFSLILGNSYPGPDNDHTS